MTSLELTLPAETLEAIARRAAELVLAQATAQTSDNSSPWLTRRQAAAYLGLPVSRLEKDRDIPSHRDRGRILYHRDELDAHFLTLGR
jgi:hypothetical protein